MAVKVFLQALLLASVLALTISIRQCWVKPGKCPAPFYSDASQCAAITFLTCKDDRSCEGKLKCCDNGCALVCAEPNAKAGTCPAPSKRPCTSIVNECKDDSKCPGSQKCCFHGCGTSCVRPIDNNPKPGSCPLTKVTPSDRLGCTDDLCGVDSDCPGVQKCCNNKCGGWSCF